MAGFPTKRIHFCWFLALFFDIPKYSKTVWAKHLVYIGSTKQISALKSACISGAPLLSKSKTILWNQTDMILAMITTILAGQFPLRIPYIASTYHLPSAWAFFATLRHARAYDFSASGWWWVMPSFPIMFIKSEWAACPFSKAHTTTYPCSTSKA